MDWKKHIDSDPEIASGKPIIKGTRLTVEHIIGLFASGWTKEQVLSNYPSISEESLNAAFAFITEIVRDESIYFIKKSVA